MNPARYLPSDAANGVETWAKQWLEEVANDMRSVLADASQVRARNERLASYLPTLTTLAASYQHQVDKYVRTYKALYPKPDKGINEWRERCDEETRDMRRIVDLCEKFKEDIRTRLSVAQSNLASIREETKARV